ncbi:MAG: DUF2806 domain-containing protein [Chloroflexi bacterium]|nr:DUF2806 domain-containing protein [Chloroflexota bacterium]
MDINLTIPAIEKLLDYAASGIGSIAGPMLAPWKARQEAKARSIATQEESESQRILAEGQATTMGIIASAQADARAKLVSSDAVVQGQLDLGTLVTQRIQFQEEKRQANIGSIVRQAALELGDKEVQDYEVDHDWTARFFDDVQDVSSEDLQQLWAKILAGEVERPGSTSYRTLRVLKDMNQDVARIFSWFCSLCIYSEESVVNVDARICSACFHIFSTKGFLHSHLNLLNTHGLVNPDYDSWYDMQHAIGFGRIQPDQTNRYPFRFQAQYWVLYPVGGPRSVKPRSPGFPLQGASLSQSGLELSKVVQMEPMDEYKAALIDHFAREGLRMTPVDSGDSHVGPLYIEGPGQ